MKTKKNRGVVYLPFKKTKTETTVFLSFGVDPLNWQSFIEIGEMACSTTVRCSRGHTIKTFLSFKYIQSRETKLSRWNMNELFTFNDQNCELHDILTRAKIHGRSRCTLSVIISCTYKIYYFRIELCFLSHCT